MTSSASSLRDDPPRFRDPEERLAAAAELRLTIARALVGTPTLPVALPAFGMRLLDVATERRAIVLVVGFEDPVARLCLRENRRAEGGPVEVTVDWLVAGSASVRERLATMARRLTRATTAARWSEAAALARRLEETPHEVPLGYFRQVVAGVRAEHAMGLVRTGFRCNQDCGMCWQNRSWGRHGPDQVLTWIEDLRAMGLRSLSISGGEPTLDPDLPRYLDHARTLGFTNRTIETNAIQAARPGVVERLRDAGLCAAFVSLHSPDAGTSDLITRAPGTFARTIRGIHAFLAAGVRVVLNAVMTRQGLETLPDLPDFIHREFGRQIDHLMISYPTLPWDPALLPEVLPEPERLRAALRRTLDRAFAVGLPVRGLDGPCGPPLCAFDADRRVVDLQPVNGPVDFRTHLPACERCAVRPACHGVRKADVEQFGDRCVAPLAAAP